MRVRVAYGLKQARVFMRKGLPFVLLALVIAVLGVPVGSALSLNASVMPPVVGRGVWAVMANASIGSSGVPLAPPGGEPASIPDAARLFVVGALLVGLAGVARRGGKPRSRRECG